MVVPSWKFVYDQTVRSVQRREDSMTKLKNDLYTLDQAAWDIWLDYRRQIKKPLFPVSWPLAQRKLQRFGATQMAVVEQSIENGWQGLFALKEDANVDAGSFDVEAPW